MLPELSLSASWEISRLRMMYLALGLEAKISFGLLVWMVWLLVKFLVPPDSREIGYCNSDWQSRDRKRRKRKMVVGMIDLLIGKGLTLLILNGILFAGVGSFRLC